MADAAPSVKRPRLDDGLFQRARKSWRNVTNFFSDASDAVQRRSTEHVKLPPVNLRTRMVPLHVNMEPVVEDDGRKTAFERVFRALETAVGRGVLDMTAHSVSCTTDAGRVRAGDSYVVSCSYKRRGFNPTRDVFSLDLELLWSASRFDEDPDLKTVLVSLPKVVDGALELDFNLVFYGDDREKK